LKLVWIRLGQGNAGLDAGLIRGAGGRAGRRGGRAGRRGGRAGRRGGRAGRRGGRASRRAYHSVPIGPATDTLMDQRTRSCLGHAHGPASRLVL
jgi:hypothetical protein